MKILLLSLNSDSVARQPSFYGGSGRSLRLLAENIEDCYIAAEESCFEGDTNDRCIVLDKTELNVIREGHSDYHYKGLEELVRMYGIDVVVYADHSRVLKTSKPQLCWAVGANETIHPQIKHLLVHNLKWQQPIIQGSGTQVHEFVLGIEIPPFEYRRKKDQILQVTNHYPQINSILLAQWAIKHKIKTIFAGPIAENYPLLNYIDYETTWYLGQIKEEEKIKLMKDSKVHASLYAHNINGPNLSTKTALNYGSWILTTNAGIMPEVIINGVNGYIINNEAEFLNAWNYRDNPEQFACWETANQWSLDKMVSSFKQVTQEVLNS